MEYTAELHFVEVALGLAFGHIYNDKRGRFPDGTEVKTSLVKEIVVKEDTTYIVTRNSVYKVVGELYQSFQN